MAAAAYSIPPGFSLIWWPFWLAILLAPLPFILGVLDIKPGALVVAFILLFVDFTCEIGII